MEMRLHPRAALGNRLQLWLGAFDTTEPPKLEWTLDGRRMESGPNVLVAMKSVRRSTLVAAQTPRAFWGVYEISFGIEPNRTYHVGVTATDGTNAQLRVRSLPESVPNLGDVPFNVLLVSCFHERTDASGVAAAAVASIPATLRPHLTLLMGDQVYLDLPTEMNFKDDVRWLANKFERDYRNNWTGHYADILSIAPSISVPDDHEYWNNFPHASPIVQNSYTSEGRKRWTDAANRMYEAFQLPQPGGFRDPRWLDVSPLSFFCLDTRTFRMRDKSCCVDPLVLDRFHEWVDHVVDNDLCGVLTTGQSFLDKEAGRFKGATFDRKLSNYGDFIQLMEGIERLAETGRGPLLFTGDVHWGRVTRSVDSMHARGGPLEIISSPSSLLKTVGKDELAKAWNWVKGAVGHSKEWPRHSAPDEPPEYIASNILGKRFKVSGAIHPQTGNQVALLSFSKAGSGLRLQVRYYPLKPGAQPVELAPLSL